MRQQKVLLALTLTAPLAVGQTSDGDRTFLRSGDRPIR
jgi:hypothetical protein